MSNYRVKIKKWFDFYLDVECGSPSDAYELACEWVNKNTHASGKVEGVKLVSSNYDFSDNHVYLGGKEKHFCRGCGYEFEDDDDSYYCSSCE